MNGSLLEHANQLEGSSVHSMPTSTWLSFTIYVFDRAELIDWIMLVTLPSILRELGNPRWFFIRYSDERGIHLRLRIEVSNDDAALFASIVRERCTFPFFVTGCFKDQQWFLPAWAASPIASPSISDQPATEVEVVPYEPEVALYGKKGILAAEQFFFESSEVVLSVLQQLRHKQIRKSVALALMELCRRAFDPASDAGEFWNSYRDLWLQGMAAGAQWRSSFVGKAAMVSPDQLLCDGPMKGVVDRLEQAFAQAARAYASLEPGWLKNRSVVNQFVHLTNNRLGLAPLEESYLAQLLSTNAAVVLAP
jgi:thiopeptide-type bacteriocin biosynthesis protein